MSRILFLLAVAAALCMVVGVVAVLLNLTAALALVAVGGLAILAAAVWLLVRNASASPAR